MRRTRARRLSRTLSHVRDAYLVLGIAGASLVALEGAGRAVRAVTRRHATEDPRVRADVYAGAAWAPELFRELHASERVEWEPYTHWRRQAFAGTFTNVDANGIRRSWNAPPAPGTRPRKIYFLGGSTTWGTGARDEGTVPSFVSKELARAGEPAWVVNEGESGYVSTQEVFRLELLLQHGERPDVVVFLDGVNDVFSAFQNRAAGLPHNEMFRRREFNLTKSVPRLWGETLRETIKHSVFFEAFAHGPGKVAPMGEREMKPLARAVGEAYAQNVARVAALGKAYGFRALFFLQPVVFTKPALTPYEREDADARAYLRPLYDECYRACVEACRDRSEFHDVSDAFAHDPAPRFIDFCHLGEPGNEVVAGRMVPFIREALDGTAVSGAVGRKLGE